ncbi:hypothetical protein KIN20_002983 [Parelaphostrongylus tenuis]|uniref:Secreted protein n=1 Tax=Parelaphostrongylus tenuis TaxID=148309 RepID=A0AAD5QDX9_PARTN|nr:hypothetical protein KIN20_002983 [Parelaphostrongylus tenuis]
MISVGFVVIFLTTKESVQAIFIGIMSKWSTTLESKCYATTEVRGPQTKWSKWRGRNPAATNLNRQFDRRASSERSPDLTRTTSPHFIANSLLLSSHSLVIM